jgi:hypothetical protein
VEEQRSPILKAVAYGINAGSGHNSQPWKIKIISDTSMLLYVDEKRKLPATDPMGRIMHVSQGTLIETLSIGASALGYAAMIDYFPEGEYSTNEMGKKPVARIVLDKQDGIKKDPLFDFIYQRSANRKVYKGPMVTDQEIAEIGFFTKNDKVEIISINNMGKVRDVIEILYKAWEIELENYGAYDESRERFRYSEKERSQKRDGLSIVTMGEGGLRSFFAEKFLKEGDSKRWHSKTSKTGFLKGQKKRLESARALVFLKTATNGMRDWIMTGRILARWELGLTKLGLGAHVYSQVVQDYPEMQALQKNFHDLLGVQNNEKIQLVMRVGRAAASYYTYRRNVEDLLSFDI